MDVILTCSLCGKTFPVSPGLVKLFLGLDIIVCSKKCLEENFGCLVSDSPKTDESVH